MTGTSREFVEKLPTEILSILSAWVSAEAREIKRNTGNTMSAREISVKLDSILDARYKAEEEAKKAEATNYPEDNEQP